MDSKKAIMAGVAFFLMTALIAVFYMKGDDGCGPNCLGCAKCLPNPQQMSPQMMPPQLPPPAQSPGIRAPALRGPPQIRARSISDIDINIPGLPPGSTRQ